MEKVFGTNSVGQFVVVLLFLFVVSGGTLDNRAFYVVWGMIFAAVYCPRYVFSYDEGTGRIAGWMTRREISERSTQGRGKRKTLESIAPTACEMAQRGG